MNDMTAVIVPKSDQINADDLIAGPMTITISAVEIRAGTEQPVSIRFEGDNSKPWKPCKSMSRVLVALWGPDANKYVGRSITLYRDPEVKWGGLAVGGIRISHVSHIEKAVTMALTETKGKRKPYVVQPLKVAQESPGAASAGTWMENLRARLDACATMEAVEAIFGTKSVRGAMEKAPPKALAEINRLFVVARERIATLIKDDDDGWPGPDTQTAV